MRQLRSLLLWVLVALALRWAVIEPRWIPSGSMLPTLQLEDRVLVEKLRVRLHRHLPTGTVVVFHPPPQLQAAGYAAETALIKRLVGLPGDQIAVRDGQLWRNGQVVQPDWKAEPMDYDLPELTVPPGELLVLGDNSSAALLAPQPVRADSVLPHAGSNGGCRVARLGCTSDAEHTEACSTRSS
jgi:signal peptidase I